MLIMKIEYLKLGKYSNSGSSVLKLMQNNTTPTLDLIVREAIQNSLDAALPSADIVNVNFKVGDFKVCALAKEFDDIENNINTNFKNENERYLAIFDSNTYGLTGNLNGIFDKNEKNQNLGKLVFQIMKPQDTEGAGGSWGIGKTVYFRAGIGLVIYYSRIKLENGKFQERLACSLVENEKIENGLLSSFKNSTGVAFFGDLDNDEVIAITNPNYIHNFLKIFSIEPYSNTVTGTTIIIPFIDEDKLLSNNVNEDKGKKWWEVDIESYLSTSIIRWYFPRMCSNYNYGPKLKAYVNNIEVKLDCSDTIIFKKFAELYQAANSNEDFGWIKKDYICYNKNLKSKELGCFTYGIVTKDELGIIKKHLPNPYDYVLLDNNDTDNNSPLIAFTRKPGMIVNYSNDGKCIGNIINPKDKFIIGLFKLNSDNEIVKNEVLINLDEYIRQSEKADHTSWQDHAIGKAGTKMLIVQAINNKISNILAANYAESKATSGDSQMDFNLATKIGKLLLPDEGFGNAGSSKPISIKKEGGRSIGVITCKNKRNKVVMASIDYDGKENKILINYNVSIKSQNELIIFENFINSTNGYINPCDFENDGLNYPCEIDMIGIKCISFNNKNVSSSPIIIPTLNDSTYMFQNYQIYFLKTKSNKCYGIKFDNNSNFKTIDFVLRISLRSNDRMIQTNFNIILKENNQNE